MAGTPARREPLGAAVLAAGTRFRVFSTNAERCAVRLFAEDERPLATLPLQPIGDGLFEAVFAGVRPGALYKYLLDERELPDPYARELPSGVHGPARVVDERGAAPPRIGARRPLGEHVFYELHVGAFSEAGTYEGVIAHLPQLAALGVTALELMPLASFAGRWGWGYDGVAGFAPHAPYGSPDALRALVARAHELRLSVFLDVVYNHFGPAGNYLSAYSPLYFSSRFENAWGAAPNFEHWAMRRYVIDNAVYWTTRFGFDGLRLDATHAIADPSPRHILRELRDRLEGLEPRPLLVAEDARNEPSLVRELGLDAVWADDFHHQLRVTLTGERDGYYAAYEPGVSGIADAIRQGWLYCGQVYPPTGEPRGKPATLPPQALVYCIQNHDQVGNRARGDRLSSRVSLAAYCAASTLLLFLPMTPLLFMGQEWAASQPFQYFTDHEPALGQAVSAGRRQEFKSFAEFADPEARRLIPDPQAPETFRRSQLVWAERDQGEHARVRALYERLLALRRSDPVLRATAGELDAAAHGAVLLVRRAAAGSRRVLCVNFGREPVALSRLPLPRPFEALLRSDGLPENGDELPGETALILGS